MAFLSFVFCTGFHSLLQSGLELGGEAEVGLEDLTFEILLPQPPECHIINFELLSG